MITARYDEESDLVRVRSEGFLTTADVQRYGMELRDAIQRARYRTGCGKVLVATSDVVQSADVMEAFVKLQPLIDPNSDRLAVMVSSSLSKMQVRRSLVSANQQAFLSESAAMTWLFAGAAASESVQRGAAQG